MTQPSRRRLMAAATTAAAAVAASLAAPARAQAGATKQKAVFQVSDADPGKWNLTLNNAQNAITDLGADGTELEIVVYGPGIGMLKLGSPVAERIGQALKGGIKVVACQNTMRGQKLTPADMLPEIGYVPAGVVELIQKQHEGWAYIRP